MIDPEKLFAAIIGVMVVSVGFDLAIAALFRTQKEASPRDYG